MTPVAVLRAALPDPLRLAITIAAVIVAILVGLHTARPPAAVGARARAQDFSAARAMVDVRVLAAAPRPTGSAFNRASAAFLARRLAGLGLSVEQRHYLVDDEARARLIAWSRGTLAPVEMENVLATLPGRDRTLPAILLTAHYDSVWGSPGAADDAAGVAAAIEIVRAIRARGPTQRDIVVLFTDGEEVGLSGAQAFWAGGGIADRIGAVVNLEARGAGGRALMFETGVNNAGMIALMAHAVDAPVANSLSAMAYRLMPNSTDYTVARTRGVPGFNFAFMGRAALYHSPLATADRLDPATVQDMGRQALPLVAALADAATLPVARGNAVFFDLPGGGFVHYAPGTGWIVLLGAAVAVALAWARARPPLDSVAGGALAICWGTAVAVLVLSLLDRLSGGAGANYYQRLAMLPRLEAQAACGLAAVLIAAVMLRGLAPRILGVAAPLVVGIVAFAAGVPPQVSLTAALVAAGAWAFSPRGGPGAWGGWIGGVALLVLLAALVQAKAPEATWLFAWPALVSAAILLAAAAIGRTVPVLLLCAIGGAAVAGALLPVLHVAMLGIGAQMPQVAAIAVPILLAAFWPLVRMRPGILPAAAAVFVLVAGVWIAEGVRHAPIASSVPRYSLDRQ